MLQFIERKDRIIPMKCVRCNKELDKIFGSKQEWNYGTKERPLHSGCKTNEDIEKQERQQQQLSKERLLSFPERKKGKDKGMERKKAIDLIRYLDALAHTRQLKPIVRNKIKNLHIKQLNQIIEQIIDITHWHLIPASALTPAQRQHYASYRLWTLKRYLYLLPARVVKPTAKVIHRGGIAIPSPV
jgi:hypothetical protein